MSTKKIIWVKNGSQEQLAYQGSGAKGQEADDVTLEQLADLCDRDAEKKDRRSAVGVHRILAAMMRTWRREKALALMREIAEKGGVHGMGDEDFLDLFGVRRPWQEWKLGDGSL